MNEASTLAEWANFYGITGSSAASLTGLTFVVIALASGRRGVSTAGLRAFVSPTIVHFGSVLALAAFMTVPRQTPGSLALGIGVLGLAGVLYGGGIAFHMRGVAPFYVPVLEDWAWHVCFPTLGYAVLTVAAALGRRHLATTLYGTAAVSVGLLFIGIHNAWDVAVSISTSRREAPAPAGSSSAPSPESSPARPNET
jgi:hypothetical protein